MKLILAEPFKRLWAGRDAFTEVERLEGEVYRELEGRRTLRTEVDGRGFFVKIHRGIGWGEVFKNLLTAKLPVLGAGQEWRAINRLHEVGVPTMTAVAYGEKGSNPAAQHSFIITEELAPTVSLEDFSINWVKQPPQPRLKHALIAEVARMTGTTGAAWNDPARGGELAKAQFARGVDVVFAAAGATGVGVYQAAKDAGKLAIGVDSNQDHLQPGTMLTSMLKRVDVAVYQALKSSQTGVTVLGLKEGGVDYAQDQYNAKLLTPEMKKRVETVRADIISGKLKVANYVVGGGCK